MAEGINHSSKSLAKTVSEEIINFIINENLNVGDKLPNEFELAAKLGVGRSTVREAIKALISRNVLEIRRGAGTFVSQKLGVADDPLGLTFFKDKHKLALDLIEIRFMIEPRIASLAAMNASDEEIACMTKLCHEVEMLIHAGENHVAKDVEFHTCIASSSKNLVMPNLIPIINTAIALFIDLTHSILKQETIQTHREILEAIKAHQPNKAHDAMLLHLAYNRRSLEKRMLDYNR
ncbi:FadR/GntR family transcriptional regulator [Clostridium formicaceticum]|uniref:GntR family transcriptional regulator n=1 Tax=Clostridium formicaceticum TaxID=1497 RepID=A0AAC9RTU8_9CLOT|nr:FadR/GntR family transcriptional regulator [Clostridium formicaceticum]AOY75306.1 GntR family transcriptional regulator [Clostridium formicaceticum]ARE89750.1 Putative L-lactate dehydrogenase operon regulatory protein [Clostridium formicaceticum]